MKVVICFPLTLPSMGEWSHSCCDVGNSQYLLFPIISFGYCKRVIVALLHQLHHQSLRKFIPVWPGAALVISEHTMFLFSACWLLFFLYYDSSTFFSLTSRLLPAMDCFHYVTYGIFTLWFSLNQMFVIKFSVAFATVVEKTRPSYVFIEVFAQQKT